MSVKLTYVQSRVSEHMEAISELFKPGVKITVVVRSPGYPDRDFLMTDDELSEAVSALNRRQTADAA